MIHKYVIPVVKEVSIPVSDDVVPITFNNNCRVSWQKNADNNLENVILEILGQQIYRDQKGTILSSYPQIDTIAYNMAVFLANNIFIQTSVHAIDPLVVLNHSLELIPESADEENALSNSPKQAYASLKMSVNILGKFEPKIFESYLNISTALAHFANGCRQNEPFVKFEQFYKVIESVFKKEQNEHANNFDKRVSDHILQYDAHFIQDTLERLRQLRNRCVHPNARQGHLSPEDLVAVRDIKSSLSEIQQLAKLSLDHPPK